MGLKKLPPEVEKSLDNLEERFQQWLKGVGQPDAQSESKLFFKNTLLTNDKPIEIHLTVPKNQYTKAHFSFYGISQGSKEKWGPQIELDLYRFYKQNAGTPSKVLKSSKNSYKNWLTWENKIKNLEQTFHSKGIRDFADKFIEGSDVKKFLTSLNELGDLASGWIDVNENFKPFSSTKLELAEVGELSDALFIPLGAYSKKSYKVAKGEEDILSEDTKEFIKEFGKDIFRFQNNSDFHNEIIVLEDASKIPYFFYKDVVAEPLISEVKEIGNDIIDLFDSVDIFNF